MIKGDHPKRLFSTASGKSLGHAASIALVMCFAWGCNDPKPEKPKVQAEKPKELEVKPSPPPPPPPSARLTVKAHLADGSPAVADIYADEERIGTSDGPVQFPISAKSLRVATEKLGGLYEKVSFQKDQQVHRDVILAFGPDMVRIEGGEGVMGTKKRYDREVNPRRKVRVKTFDIDRSNVTVSQYQTCVDAGTCNLDTIYTPEKLKKYCNRGKLGREDHPADCINWYQARDYCRWAGKRLPTNEEWEFTARSRGKDIPYPWGDEVPTIEKGFDFDMEGTSPSVAPSWPVCDHPKNNSQQGVCDLLYPYGDWTSFKFCTGEPFLAHCEDDEMVSRGGLYVWGMGSFSAREGLKGSSFRCARSVPYKLKNKGGRP